MIRRKILIAGAMLTMFGPACSGGASAADMTVREIAAMLHMTRNGPPADLSTKDLSRLDLSSLDLKNAIFKGTEFFASDLSRCDLTGVDLSGAHLDRVTMTATDFSRANLRGASILRPSSYDSLAATARDAPIFAGADLSDAKIFGRFAYANFTGADLTNLTGGPKGKNGFIAHLYISDFRGADLSRAKLDGADLTQAVFIFAKLEGASLKAATLKDADFSGADLRNADLRAADLSGADLSSAKLDGADIEGAILSGVIGLDAQTSLVSVKNADKAIR